MNEKDAQPLTPPPKLSRAAAARMHEALTQADEHGNYLFKATGAILATKANGDLVELATIGEQLLVCQQAISGFDGGS